MNEGTVSSGISAEYKIVSEGIEALVSIYEDPKELVGVYSLKVPRMDAATAAFFEDLKGELLKRLTVTPQEVLDVRMADELKRKFIELSKGMAIAKIPHLSEKQAQFISGTLVHEMLGLGPIEFLLKDDNIEEICVNSSSEPLWVYHRQFGWLKTDITIPSETQIWNYASAIARRIGRQITVQTPLLDAYLTTGDRVNATLTPISAGNTITIRKFARKPWTITDYINLKTLSAEVAAFLWLATQYESSMIVSGGTGSGKTSMLNVVCSFFPANQRVVSIEQTREVTLPSHLQWVPLAVREATAEGKGEVTMLDLLVNSLRMRPDRILVGEIRRAEEAQVLFEAIHTGHSVYATMHAETISETLRRLTSPPIALPPVMMESLPLIVTMFRDRRTGIRRIFEIGEIIPSVFDESKPPSINLLFRWKAATDTIEKVNAPVRFREMLKTFTNMTDSDIERTLAERVEVLNWMTKRGLNNVEDVGRMLARYNRDPATVMAQVRSG
jgi:flagellar protein FlaI